MITALLGVLVARLEGWPLSDGLYFPFITGLTIGYGDLVPKAGSTRVVAVLIGVCGIILTGLVVAVAFRRCASPLTTWTTRESDDFGKLIGVLERLRLPTAVAGLTIRRLCNAGCRVQRMCRPGLVGTQLLIA
ncbi:potassium channel family protein [Variovorax rhizosphaerae]|uniref:Potassium channel family protein n=1 Tax=Variovorax rhizosphaerae TaxID=1836200 RepID=A0ABU8WM39_9BURK